MRFLLATALCLGLSASVVAEDNYVSVSATASVSAEPDLAFVSASVRTDNMDPAVALTENNKKMSKIFQVLTGTLDIDKKNISTSNFSLQPRNVYQNNKHVFVGYRVENTITVKVCELETVGKLITALVSNGANRLNGVSFAIENREELENKARIAAVKKARAKAATLVETAGSRVGDLKTISESQSRQSSPRYAAQMDRSAAPGGDTPIAAGEQSVSITVNATFKVIR